MALPASERLRWKTMKAHELWMQLMQMERKVERNRLKRFAYTTLLYAAIFFGIFYAQDQLEGLTLLGIIGEFVACIVIGGISVLFNAVIFDQLNRCSRAEDNMLKSLRKQYHEACEKEKGSGKNDRVPNE